MFLYGVNVYLLQEVKESLEVCFMVTLHVDIPFRQSTMPNCHLPLLLALH
jgi:hypothetical protein